MYWHTVFQTFVWIISLLNRKLTKDKYASHYVCHDAYFSFQSPKCWLLIEYCFQKDTLHWKYSEFIKGTWPLKDEYTYFSRAEKHLISNVWINLLLLKVSCIPTWFCPYSTSLSGLLAKRRIGSVAARCQTSVHR